MTSVRLVLLCGLPAFPPASVEEDAISQLSSMGGKVYGSMKIVNGELLMHFRESQLSVDISAGPAD